ncbi:MAG: helix-turn-helix domain-containing protein [Dongiaceae bacterium]
MSATFVEPHQYQDGIKPSRTQIVPSRRGSFQASLSNLALRQLTVQRGSQSLPIAVRTELPLARCVLMFHAGQDGAPFAVNGIDLDPAVLVMSRPAEEHFLRVPADCRWATMTLTPDALGTAWAALTGEDRGPRITVGVVRPGAADFARLRARHHSIMRLVEGRLDLAHHPEVARAADQALLAALTECLAGHPEMVVPETGGRGRTVVLRRFYELLEESEGLPLYVTEACTRLGVSVRTLHTACMEHTGLSPHRFMSLRRMHLARRALTAADPARATVTGIAADLGFWELGRFSVRYRRLFGESPSATLARPPA